MKNLKYLFVAICLLFTSVSMTSCLDDDNEDYSITPEEYSYYMGSMPGTYYGKMYFWNDTITLTDTKKDKIDSLQNVMVSVRGANDSTITVSIPSKYLGKNIKNTDDNKALKAALDAAPAQTITMKYYLYMVQENIVTFGIYPTEINKMTLNYGGQDHEVAFTWYSSYNFNGQYYSRRMSVSMCLANIKVDDVAVWTATSSPSNSDELNNPIYTFSLSK